MVVIVDSKRRVTLPKAVVVGDAFTVEMLEEGQFVLKRIDRSGRKMKLSRKHGLLVASTGRKITMAQTRLLLNKLP